MYGIKKTILKSLLILLWGFAANALQCLECQDMPSPEDCRTVTTCSSNSQCFVEQVVTSGGVILYDSGCLSTSRCEHSGRKRQETVSGTDIVACVSCCKEDFCNIEGCGVVAERQPKRPPLCFYCGNQVDPDSCRDVTLCDQDQMCALIETYNSHQWKSECAPKLQCQILGNLSLANVNGHCYTCCQDDFCNNYCNKQITRTTTSSQSPAVTTFTPTKLITTTLSATVSNSNSSKQTHNIEVTTMNASTVNIFSKSTTVSHTSPQKLTAMSTVTVYSSATTEIIPSATSAHTYPSSTLSKSHTSTFNDISTSPVTLAASSSKATTAKLGTINTTFTPNITSSCINRKFDICFVLDSSGSLGERGFEKELHFVSDVVRNIAMETNLTTHFCVVRLSTDAFLAVALKQFHNTDSIINSIGTIPYRTGETSIHVGLNKAVDELLQNGRHGVEKEIVLITDGKSDSSAWTLHDRHHMQSHGISMYAVSIGTQTNSRGLQTIVTNKNHLLEIPDADHLKTSFVKIVQALCGEATLKHDSTCKTRKHLVEYICFRGGKKTSWSHCMIPRIGFIKKCDQGKNENLTDVFLQSSTATMSPTTKPMNKNTSLTTGTWNQTKSVKWTAATGLASSTSNRTITTTNVLNVTSLKPRTECQTTTETGITGSKHPYTLPANINAKMTDVFLQTSTTTISPTTKTLNKNTSPTTVHWDQTGGVNSTATAPSTIPASNRTRTTTNIVNYTLVDPLTHYQTTVATGVTGSKHPYSIKANSSQNGTISDVFLQSSTTVMSPTPKPVNKNTSLTTEPWNQTRSVNSTAATGLTSPASSRIGTTRNNMNVPSVDPKTDFQTTIATGVTGSKSPVTRPANSIACAVCSGPEFLCEKLYAIQQCDPPNNYCINKLYNHIDGSRIVTRQCGTFQTCYRDWYLGSSDSDKCRRFDERSILTLDFTCTYCCINDNCNKPIRPSHSSLYIDE